MDVHHRRDAMCGKFAVCNVLRQAGVRYTLTKSFTVRPCDAEFAAEAAFTDDVIDRAFFGCGKVIYKQGLNDLSNYMARSGYKHHLCVVYGRHMQAVREAFDHYLGYDIQIF